MNLTPIRIRGKNNVDKSKAAVLERKALKRPAGRPLKPLVQKRTMDNLDESSESSRQLRKKIKKKKKIKISALESLPAEILGEIFLYCMNFNMPRCSLYIARKLSSRAVYKQTIIEAFGPVWHLWYGFTDRYPPKPTTSVTRHDGPIHPINDRPGDYLLQADVLRSKWAKAEILSEAKDLWIQKSAPRRVLKKRYKFRPDHFEHIELRHSPLTAVQGFETDYQKFCDFVADVSNIKADCNWDKCNDVHYKMEIPLRLLTGPWSEDMLRLLFWLARGGAQVQWTPNSLTAEAARAGFERAVELGELRVLYLFDWMKAIRRPNLMAAVRKSGGNRVAVVGRVLHHGYVEDRFVADAKLMRDYIYQLKLTRDEAKKEGDWDTHAACWQLWSYAQNETRA